MEEYTTIETVTKEASLKNSNDMIRSTANSMVITTQDEYELAGKLLVEIKTRMKQVKDYWQKPKADAKAAHQTICDREKEMLAPLNEAESILKKNMVSYQAAVEKARKEEEERLRRLQQEEAERLLQQAVKAEEEGNDKEAAVSMALAEMMNDMPQTPTMPGPKAEGTSVRKVWKARVVDPYRVPAYVNGMEIREIKMSALNALAKMSNGTAVVPGIEFYQEASISAKSRW